MAPGQWAVRQWGKCGDRLTVTRCQAVSVVVRYG